VLSAVVAAVVVLGAAGGGAYAAARALDARTPAVAASETPATTQATTPATPTPTPTPTADPDAEFTIVAAGDVLTHAPVNSDAKTADGFDYSAELAAMDPWIQGADLAICHLEVPIAPAGTKPSGFPIFGAPSQIAAALKAQGWDGCSTASNHSVDRGYAGIKATLDALDAAGLGHAGSARSAAEEATPQLYKLQRAGQTITVAHIAAAYGTNGMPVDADKPWSLDLIDVPHMIAQATAARAAGADLVIASVHCCVEYQTAPTALQQQVDQQLADSGVIDLVIGHHAHVPQPVAKLSGGPRGEGMWVAYGLGNYISNQDASTTGTAATDSGILLTVHVASQGAFAAEGRAAGPAHVTGVEWTPITVDRLGGHKVFALPQIAAGTKTLSASQVAARLARVTAAAGTQAPERTTPPTPTGPPPVVVPRVQPTG
jgi:poly-gamma-glutamate synthesis protein (capsule biosynthesis protein)